MATPFPRKPTLDAIAAVAPPAPAPSPPARLPRRGTARGDAQAREILDSLPVPVLSLLVPSQPAQQTRVAWINRAAEDVLGRSAEDLGREPTSIWGHVHADDVTTLRTWLAKPTDQPLCATIRFLTREGRLRPYELVAKPRAESPVAGFTAVDLVLHDVSSHRALQQAVEDREQQLHALAESSRDVVFHLRLHPQLTVAWTNDAAPNLLGISPQELHDDASSLFRTVFPEHRDRLRQTLQAAVGGPTSIVFDINRHGERVTVELDLTPVRSAGQTALLAVGRRVPTPSAASAVASAPQNATSTVAPDGSASPAPAVPSDAAALSEANVLEAAGLARIDVGVLMRQVLRTVSLADRNVEVQLEQAPLQADVETLRPALEALVHNVAQHTPAEAAIRIVVARAMAGVLVSVADDGPGHRWPSGHRANVKGIADLADRSLAGGAGFAALAAAAERHTGRAAMQSVPGAGTTVRLLLHDAQPITDPAPHPALPAGGVSVAPAPRPAAAPRKEPSHLPAFRDSLVDDLSPRFIEVDA